MVPFFSVILPTYNRAHLIGKAIESVLYQTYQSWELLIIDDGSTDNTKQIISAFADERVKYIYQNNSERSIARNNGIARAQGRYICFLDSDDYYLDNHLQNLHDAIETSNFAEAVFITDVTRDEEGRLIRVAHERISDHKNNVCFILSSAETVIPARIAVHSKIFKQYQFDPALTVSEDSELLCRIGAKYPFIQTNGATAVYHLHEQNTSHRNNNPFERQLVALKTIFANEELKPFIPANVKNQKLSKCYYGIAQFHLLKENYPKMMTNLLKSIYYHPLADNSNAKIFLLIKYLPALLG